MTLRARFGRIIPVAFAGLLGACGGEPTIPAFVVADSAGVRIAHSSSPARPEVVRVGPRALTVVEADFGAPEHFLFDANDAVLLPDRRFVVGNSGSKELFFFSPEGALLRVVAGEGEGPGELSGIFSLSACEDRIVVEEPRRLSFFDLEGDFVRVERMAGHLADSRASLEGMSPDCSRVLMRPTPSARPASATDVSDLDSPLYWVSPETESRDTVAMVRFAEAQAREVGGFLGWSMVPYGLRGAWGVRGDTVLTGSSESHELRWFDRGGALAGIARWDDTRKPVTAEDWAHFANSREELLRLYPEEAPYVPDLDFSLRRETKPAYSKLLVDELGRLWVQDYGRYALTGPEASTLWTVLSADGRWLARVEVPAGLQVLSIGWGLIVGLVHDAQDLERVEVYSVPEI